MKRTVRAASTFRVVSSLLLALLTPLLSAQNQAAKGTSAADDHYVFDVVSVRRSNFKEYSRWSANPGSYTASNITALQLVYYAYHRIDDSSGLNGIVITRQIVGLPKWAETMPFDLAAKADEKTTAALSRLPYRQLSDLYPRMLQPVLEDRFNLRVHHEPQRQAVYTLQIAKKGSKLKESAIESSQSSMSAAKGRLSARGYRINQLIATLSAAVGRVVIDRTGLTGLYDYSLEWRPEDDANADNSSPSIYTALKEQLGLELVRSVELVDTLVIDHIDKPTEN